MKTLLVPIIMICLFAFASCSSMKVYSDYDKEVDFSGYSSFTFADADLEKSNMNELNYNRVMRATQNELRAKEYTESKNGELEIHIHAVVENMMSATASTDYYGGGYPYYRRRVGWGHTYGTTSVDVHEYREGTLIIDLVDVKAKKLIWQGLGTSIIPDNPAKLDDKITEAVKKIFSKYPPK